MKTITLTTGSKGLRLRNDGSGSCSLSLLGTAEVVLGKGSAAEVAGKLGAAVGTLPAAKPSTHLQGIAAARVLVLDPPGATISVGQSHAGRVLFFQDHEGCLVEQLVLTARDRKRWVAQLHA